MNIISMVNSFGWSHQMENSFVFRKDMAKWGMTAKWSVANVNNEHVPQRILIQQLASSGMKTFPDAGNSCMSIPAAVNYVRSQGYFASCPDFLFLDFLFPGISWFLIPSSLIPHFLAEETHLTGERYVSLFLSCPDFFLVHVLLLSRLLPLSTLWTPSPHPFFTFRALFSHCSLSRGSWCVGNCSSLFDQTTKSQSHRTCSHLRQSLW